LQAVGSVGERSRPFIQIGDREVYADSTERRRAADRNGRLICYADDEPTFPAQIETASISHIIRTPRASVAITCSSSVAMMITGIRLAALVMID